MGTQSKAVTRRAWVAVLTAVLVSLGALAGCAERPGAEPGGLDGFYRQDVRWAPCPVRDGARPELARLECANVAVPLDYREPAGERIGIALSRLPASNPAARIGSLLVNPGGPGGGREVSIPAALAHRALLDRYDWVGYDPRGVGESAPVGCLGPEESAAMLIDGDPPRTDQDWRDAEADARRFVQACRDRSGRLGDLVGLANSARDLDVLRAALGERRLTFLGTSYGGQLAAAYATLFPAAVGRMVLNSPGNPTKTQKQVLLDQARAFERSLSRFAGHCVRAARCPLGADRAAVLASVDRLLVRLESAPVPVPPRARLTRAAAEVAMISALAEPERWPALASATGKALGGDGGPLLGLSGFLLGRDEAGAFTNFLSANTVINCVDSPDRHTPAEVKGMSAEFARASPRFGVRMSTRMLECAPWPPVHGRVEITTAPGTPPVLVVGNAFDPEAPLDSVRQVAGLLGSGRLIVADRDGHGSYGTGSSCVDAHVDAYLLDGTLPPGTAREVYCR